MSLRVWLPLNGDLRNNGLSDYSLSMYRGTETYNNNGKIGKCFYSNGVNTIKILNIIPDFYKYSEYSLCAWAYVESQNTSHSGSAIISAGNWNSQVLNLSLSDWSTDHYTKLRVSGTNWNNTYSYNFAKNTWYHIVVSSDGNKTYAYVNGTLIGNTVSGFLPSSIEGNDICIGGATYYGGMQFFGRINDVRIYDHVLSLNEIKELSKGLVCHYKLDGNGANPNLVPNQGIYTQNNPYILTTNRIDGYKWLPNSYFEVEPSTTYTFSVYCDAECSPKHATDGSEPDKFSMCLYLCDDGNESKASTGGYDSAVNCNSKNNNYKNFGQRHCWTYTTTSTQKYMSIRMNNYGAGTETITHKYWYFKVEKGDKLTTYIPNINDELYSKLNYNSNIIYDTSGYGYDGVKNGSGDIITSTNTARNSLSSFFGEHNTPRIDMLDSSLFPALTSCTISWWEYSTVSSNTLIFTGIAAGGSKYIAAGSPTNRLYDSNIGTSGITMYKDGVVVSTTYSGTNVYHNNCFRTQNEWHHYCITGVNLSSWDKFYINYYSSSFPTQAYLSDVRIYSTVLSEDDVKELYQVCANIDKGNNLHTYELLESGSNELLAVPYTNWYSQHNDIPSNWYKNINNGEIYFESTTVGSHAAGSRYIPINPTNKTYYYDFCISISAGNLFYIGFERYDKDKTARSNNATVYIFGSKPSSDLVKARYKGVVNLSTDGVNPCAFIALRILNRWSGSTSETEGKATIHYLSLREVNNTTGFETTKLFKTGVFKADDFFEKNDKSNIEKDGIINMPNQFIEI